MSKSILSLCCTGASLALLLGMSAHVVAQAASPPSSSAVSAGADDDATRLAALEHDLAMYAQEGRRERLSRGLTSMALGAVMLPSGLVLTKRDDRLLKLAGVGLLATGAAELAALSALLRPSDVERVAVHHQQRKASGKPAAELIRETEAEWKREAEVETKAYRWAGSLQLGIGAAALPLGLAMLLKHEVGSMPQMRQINVGATLIGLGAPFVLTGVRMLFTTNATEASWRAHQLHRASWAQQASRMVSVSPIRDGALLGASAPF